MEETMSNARQTLQRVRACARLFAIITSALMLSCGRVAEDHGVVPNDPPSQGADMLAVSLGTSVKLISLDGRVRSVLDGDPFFEGVDGVDVGGNGSFLLVRAYAQKSPSSGMRIATIGSDGSVATTASFAVSFAGGSDDSALRWSPLVGGDGAVVLDDSAARTLRPVVAGSGANLVGYSSYGATRDGYFAVGSHSATAVSYGWWTVGEPLIGTNMLSSQDPAELEQAAPRPFGGSLVRLDLAGRALRVETPSNQSTIAMPEVAAYPGIVSLAASEMFETDERWLLLGTSPGHVVRVDIHAGTAEALSVVSPSGYRPFANCTEPSDAATGVQIDRDGRVFRAFRTDDHVAAFATTDGSHWSQVGGAFTGVGTFDVSESRGTYVVSGARAVDCWTAGPTWSSPARAEFVGDHTLFVRPSAGTAVEMFAVPAKNGPPRAAFSLSRSGRWGARWVVDASADAAELRIADLEKGTETPVLTDATRVHSEPTWLWKQ